MSIVANNGTSFLETVDVPNLTSAGGLQLFVGGKDGVVHEYKYHVQNDSWTAGFKFISTNGHAGIGPYVRGSGIELWMFNDAGILIGFYSCAPPYVETCPFPNRDTPRPWFNSMQTSTFEVIGPLKSNLNV